MAEGRHHWASGEVGSYLGHCAVPAPHVRDVGRGWQVEDRVEEALGELHTGQGEGEAQELNFSFGELEFGVVEDDAVAATGAQKAAGPLEAGLDGVVIEEGIVYTASLPLKTLEQPVQAVCVG